MIRSRWSNHWSFLAFFFRNRTKVIVVSDCILALGDRLPSLLDFVCVLRIVWVKFEEDLFLLRCILTWFGMEFEFLQGVLSDFLIRRFVCRRRWWGQRGSWRIWIRIASVGVFVCSWPHFERYPSLLGQVRWRDEIIVLIWLSTFRMKHCRCDDQVYDVVAFDLSPQADLTGRSWYNVHSSTRYCRSFSSQIKWREAWRAKNDDPYS